MIFVFTELGQIAMTENLARVLCVKPRVQIFVGVCFVCVLDWIGLLVAYAEMAVFV